MKKREETIMSRVIDRMNEIEIPPCIREKMGTKKDWKKEVSSEFIESTFKNAEKLKSALRELSKN